MRYGTIAVDFDGVIHDDKNIPKGRRMGPPMPGARDKIEQWLSEGIRVVIHTTRATGPKETRAVLEWLHYFEFPILSVTNIKPDADMYLDDKAITFRSWDEL